MRITAFLAAVAFGAANAAPADACKISPRAQHMYWPEPPEALRSDEVALEVMFVRYASEEEFRSTDANADFVIITDCGPIGPYIYRVQRALRGEYKGPLEIRAFVFGGIADEFKDGQSRIVVGKLHKPDMPYFHMRAFRQPDEGTWHGPTFPVPEIRLK